jgi:hypothetical protein
MANPEHLKILEQGVKTWNRWREQNPKAIPELGGAHHGFRRGALQGGTPVSPKWAANRKR